MSDEKPWGQRHYEALSPGTDMDEGHLKRIAKWLKREEGITHGEALNRIAQRMGYAHWAHLSKDSTK